MAVTYVKDASTWKEVDNLYVKDAGTWKTVQTGWIKSSGTWTKFFEAVLRLVISSNTNNYNIRTAALAAGWNGSDIVDVFVQINSGVIVGSTSTGTPAMDTGTSWPVGSTITINNEGKIQGRGGNGGYADLSSPQSGLPGGDALNLQINTTITNASGSIWGGGGGGGGAADVGQSVIEGEFTEVTAYGGGGGGGGGAGSDGGTGGAPGVNVVTTIVAPSAGSTGISTSGGGGGFGGTGQNSTAIATGGTGGAGGGPGTAGTGSITQGILVSAGGAAGKAVDLNGFTVTWNSGSGSPNVLGAVS